MITWYKAFWDRDQFYTDAVKEYSAFIKKDPLSDTYEIQIIKYLEKTDPNPICEIETITKAFTIAEFHLQEKGIHH